MTLILIDDDVPARAYARVPEGEAAPESPLRDIIYGHPNYAYADLQRVVSGRLRRPGNVLYELVQCAGTDIGEAAFVDRVARDVRAGRFMLLVVGDGITDGVERTGQYLRRQASLAFDLGLIEMPEYRFEDPLVGRIRRIMQPRLLARTVVLERHVIRDEMPGVGNRISRVRRVRHSLRGAPGSLRFRMQRPTSHTPANSARTPILRASRQPAARHPASARPLSRRKPVR